MGGNQTVGVMYIDCCGCVVHCLLCLLCYVMLCIATTTTHPPVDVLHVFLLRGPRLPAKPSQVNPGRWVGDRKVRYES